VLYETAKETSGICDATKLLAAEKIPSSPLYTNKVRETYFALFKISKKKKIIT
jgi:hypothetical protein